MEEVDEDPEAKLGMSVTADMSKNNRSALLVGVSGLIGGHCLRLLLQDDLYSRVTDLVRRALEINDPKLNQHRIDFDRLQEFANLIQADDVFCCLGATIKKAGSQEVFRKVDFTYVVQTAALALKNSAHQFLVVSSLGANTHSRVFYSRVKEEMEEAVGKLPFEGIHIFRPSLLLGDRQEFRLGERIGSVGMRLASFAMVGPWRKYRPIQGQTVAQAMVNAAKMKLPGLNVWESDRIAEIAVRDFTKRNSQVRESMT